MQRIGLGKGGLRPPTKHMNRLILAIAELVIKMLKKRNLEASEKLHAETYANYRIFKNIEKIKEDTARLEDKLALATTILDGVKTVAGDKVPKAVEILSEKANIFNNLKDRIYRNPVATVQDDAMNLLKHQIAEADRKAMEQRRSED